jgi:hypothetical protein
MSKFKDAEHLFRVAVVFALGIIVFVVARMALVPKSFGEYGHYRGAAIAEIAAQPIVFAGHQACDVCHSDVAATKGKGKHAGVDCEACHGAQAAHVADPSSVQPPKLDTAVLCVRCHELDSARPKTFPQIVAREHDPGGVPCDTCHQPHSPLLGLGVKP